MPSGTALNGVVEAGPCIRTMQEDYDDEVEHTAIQSLYDRAREKDHQPFFQIISFTSPHTPFTVSQEYWDRYEGNEIDEPAVDELPFEELDYHSKALFFAHGRHRHRVTKKHLMAARQAYYGMISYIDDKVGHILDTLEKTGQRDNTAVFFVSDHGEMLGERGMWFKQTFWEWSSHVPFIASIPGIVGGQRCDKVVSLVDLLPTFLDLAGTEKSSLVGQSVLSLMNGNLDYWPDTAISDYLAIGPCVPCRMVRKGKFKFIYTHGHPALLFDLDADPKELNNLAKNLEFLDVLSALQVIAFNNWDPEELSRQVQKSQEQRKIIKTTPGPQPKWDFVARTGDEARFVREQGVDVTKGRLRLPKVMEVPADWPPLDQQTVTELIAGTQSLGDFLK